MVHVHVGDYVVWRGIADRLVGKVLSIGPAGFDPEIERIDGTRTRVGIGRLRPATDSQVNWAIYLGGCTIPPTGEPPINCLSTADRAALQQ